MADFAFLDGKVVGGNGDDGVLIEFLEVKHDKNAKTGDDMVWLEMGGTATTVLLSNYAPEQGRKELPEPLPVSTRIDLLNAGQKDNKITFDQLNRTFNLNPPLEDREDEVLRFLPDAEDSVHDAIVGKSAYFRMKLASGKTGDKPTDFYANVVSQAKTLDKKVATVKDLLASIRKRKEEKAKELESSPF